MYKKRFTKDISSKDGTIGNVLKTHQQEWYDCKSMDEMRSLVKMWFEEKNINTPDSRKLLLKLEHMGLSQGLQYLQNVLFVSMGMGTY